MSDYKQPKTRHTFTQELKSQIVQLYHNGKRKCD